MATMKKATPVKPKPKPTPTLTGPAAVKEYLISMADDLAKGMKDFGVTQKTISQTENSMKDLFSELEASKNEPKTSEAEKK